MLEREIEGLDENGWNREGRISSATLCRVQCTTGFVLEGVLEMCLGGGLEEEDVGERIE